MRRPMQMPRTGRIVTHFSLGSFFSSQGFTTSPFVTLLVWKYLWARSSKRARALDEPKLEGGLEGDGLANGLGPPVRCDACDSTPSPKGFRPSGSFGVPGRWVGVGTAVEAADGAPATGRPYTPWA